ncbi:MAG: DUF3253 domain-containing protein [Planctomycetes bacterium]|nr:DUF3253 domain-containing protein [Planctomycetota bacterium]
MPTLPSKPCITCGRIITWRKKWERDWDTIRYCSDRCKKGITNLDTQIESTILELLKGKPKSTTICPSQAARLVGGEDESQWRPLMEPARAAARRLVAKGLLVITQGGRVVDPSTARGPIRLRKK